MERFPLWGGMSGFIFAIWLSYQLEGFWIGLPSNPFEPALQILFELSPLIIWIAIWATYDFVSEKVSERGP